MSAKSFGSSLIDGLVLSEVINVVERSFEIPGAVSPKIDQFSKERPPPVKFQLLKGIFVLKCSSRPKLTTQVSPRRNFYFLILGC